MIIVGEKINGAIPRVADAICNRDRGFIMSLVKQQEEQGADYLDVCAGGEPGGEYDTLCWLIDVVQAAATKPICIDSPNPKVLARVLPHIEKPGLINSVSGEGEKCDILAPVLQSNPDWQVITLACDNNGIAVTAEEKLRIAAGLIAYMGENGISPERIYVDPLVLAISAVPTAALHFVEASVRLKEMVPGIKIIAALSNVSYGMPARALVNRNFLTMAICAGLDAVICDPLNRSITETIYAAEVLTNRDRHCRRYNSAYRAGKIG